MISPNRCLLTCQVFLETAWPARQPVWFLSVARHRRDGRAAIPGDPLGRSRTVNPQEPRRIQRDDPVADFHCGIESLYDWLALQVLRNEEHGDSRTYVSGDVDTSRIVRYYPLVSWPVSRKHSGGWLSRNAPEPVSVILVGRLAVARPARRAGPARHDDPR